MTLQEIGRHLRDARRSRKLSQAQLAQQFGMSRAAISGIERGTIREIGVRKLMRLCDALGLDLRVEPQARRPSLEELQRELRGDKAGR